MRVGQTVRLNKEGENWFGKYTDTEATIVQIHPDQNTVDVKAFDGHVFFAPRDYVTPIHPNCPVIPKKEENVNICNHENKYYNVVSASLKFWYCPDCKSEVY